MNKVIFISAAGTGGHIFPALALVEYLLQVHPDMEFVWFTSDHRTEKSVWQKNKVPSGVKMVQLKNPKSPLAFLQSCFKVAYLVLKHRPSLTLGFGNASSLSPCLTSWFLGVPMFIHEQNARMGRANRLLSLFAKRVFVAYTNLQKGFKTIVTGTPLRKKIVPRFAQKRKIDDKLVLLILGGSGGASEINRILPRVVSRLNNIKEVIHQVGKQNSVAEVINAYPKGTKVEVIDFIENISDMYSRADLVVTRAGALTLGEICTVGLASVLIPYPRAADNHQFYNAQELKAQGMATLLLEDSSLEENLIQTISSLNYQACWEMGQKAKLNSNKEAAEKIYQVLKNWLF